jgi:hypothetical protein
MQYTTIALASFIILFGLYTLITSIKSPEKLVKLKYMRGKLGMKAGTTIHTIAYVLVPFLFGYFMLSAGLNGISIQDFITK